MPPAHLLLYIEIAWIKMVSLRLLFVCVWSAWTVKACISEAGARYIREQLLFFFFFTFFHFCVLYLLFFLPFHLLLLLLLLLYTPSFCLLMFHNLYHIRLLCILPFFPSIFIFFFPLRACLLFLSHILYLVICRSSHSLNDQQETKN